MDTINSALENVPKWVLVAIAVVLLLCLLYKMFMCPNMPPEAFGQIPPDVNHAIMFYMEGCTHCVALEPIWKQIEQQLQNNNKVFLEKIEANSGHPLLKEFAVSGFPTIYKIKGDEKIKYDGDRSKEDLLKFITA